MYNNDWFAFKGFYNVIEIYQRLIVIIIRKYIYLYI